MKFSRLFYFILLFFFSCRTGNKTDIKEKLPTGEDRSETTSTFFPVTSYIKGQILDIKSNGLNPLKYVTSSNKTDSSWLKMENLDGELSEFLSPVIDSANLLKQFSQTSFVDETLDALTLTYDPVATLPDSFLLRHWDVYINPHNGQVKRIYFLKELPGKIIKQLTWESGKRCSILTISGDSSGKPIIEKKVLIKWDF